MALTLLVYDRSKSPLLAAITFAAGFVPYLFGGMFLSGLADRVMAATTHELSEQTRLRATEDFKEGVKATSERRAANFRGR